MTGTVTETAEERTGRLDPTPGPSASSEAEKLDPLVLQLLEQHRALLRELQWAYKQLDTYHRLEVEGALKDLTRTVDEKLKDRQLQRSVDQLIDEVAELRAAVPNTALRRTAGRASIAVKNPRRAARALGRRLPAPVKARVKRLTGGAAR